MKNIFIYPAAVAVALCMGLTSCNDFLDVEPTDKTVQDSFFTSDAMVESNSLSLYACRVWDIYAHDFMWKVDLLGGDMYYTYSNEGQWYFGTYTPVNEYINQGWTGLYKVISFANSIIHDMPANCKGGVSQEAITEAQAEARCIRAYCYMLIAELWHDAPIVENNSGNIQSNDLQLPRNKQKDIYRFALEDLDFAVEHLQNTDRDAFRANRLTALAVRAKLLVTMASHTDYGYDRTQLYAQAAADAAEVIAARPDITTIDYSTLFDCDANNGPESLLAIQCDINGYGYGNGRNAAWSRSSVIADETWGEGKGPTISLQKSYSQDDKRRQWCYMGYGDYYPNLNKDKGGYTYHIVSLKEDGSELEARCPMNAHLKKYVIGKSTDCGGRVGLNQAAGNNIYLVRLADVYLLRTEALMGTATSTQSAEALEPLNKIRARAGLDAVTSVTYEELLTERRRELAFESVNWYDIVRYRYRVGDERALEFLNTGYGTGYNRAAMYVAKRGTTDANGDDPDRWQIVDNKGAGGDYDPILLSASAFVVPLPAAATTASPQLLKDPVDYYKD